MPNSDTQKSEFVSCISKQMNNMFEVISTVNSAEMQHSLIEEICMHIHHKIFFFDVTNTEASVMFQSE